jgi:hypothetical protein
MREAPDPDLTEPIERYAVRLFVADKEEIERIVKPAGGTWIGYLRMLVHRSLATERKGRVIK